MGRALSAAALDGGRPDARWRPILPIAAIGHNTVPAPTTPWVNPGQFTVKLTVNGKSYTQPIVVKQDPRVKTPALAMQQVYTLSKATYYGAVDAQAAARQARALRDQIADLRPRASGAAADALAALDKKLESLEPTPQAPAEGRGRGGRGGAVAVDAAAARPRHRRDRSAPRAPRWLA